MGSRGRRVAPRYQFVYLVFFCLLLFGLLVTAALQFWPRSIASHTDVWDDEDKIAPIQTITIPFDSPLASSSKKQCLFHTCFDVYHCGYKSDNTISVYVYPPIRFLDVAGVPLSLPASREFNELRHAIAHSKYATSDLQKACLLLPQIDLLNQNNVRLREASQSLAALPSWNGGVNHLLFNMLPGGLPDYNSTLDVHTDKALLAGGGFSTLDYRSTYDVAIPVFNALTRDLVLPTPQSNGANRRWLLMSSQTRLHPEYLEALASVDDPGLVVLDACREIPANSSYRCTGSSAPLRYPHILQESTFCLVLRGARLGHTALADSLMAGCIPVICADGYVLPFSEVLDWNRAAVMIAEDDLPKVMSLLRRISSHQIHNMRRQVEFLWRQYFSSMRFIALTTLDIINDRVFPYAARSYEMWNDPPNRAGVASPPFLPPMPAKLDGFTALILTYDRLEYLFRVIEQVARAPSLAKVLVVWNNQLKVPPPASMWPKISKPLKVIQTRSNRLSNRFFPYDAIETQAILSLDDDILMLTTDELEFGYQVWREFPDRLVGFPSRLHLRDNVTGMWKYESEWTSAISMVLTGASFYHKHYNHLYTNAMPGNIKEWVDEHMNCEDIAMNFLIANVTGEPPVKVTPRQKFRCPECLNIGMLSADLTHMVERSDCITKFTNIYGMMPLKTVEFRADPVLYKDNYPNRLKHFPDIGSL